VAAREHTHRTIFRDSRLAPGTPSVRMLTPDAAVARTPWRLEGHRDPLADAPLPPREGLLVLVLQRRTDGWTIVDAQNTDIVEGVPSRPQ
jgi:hypothetical protein